MLDDDYKEKRGFRERIQFNSQRGHIGLTVPWVSLFPDQESLTVASVQLDGRVDLPLLRAFSLKKKLVIANSFSAR